MAPKSKSRDAFADAIGLDDELDDVKSNPAPVKMAQGDDDDDDDDGEPSETGGLDDLDDAPAPRIDASRGGHLTRVTSDVKGGVDVTLAPCTIIVGENAAGKSAVLDSVRLVLTGKHPVGPHPADVLRLSTGGDSLIVEAQTSHGDSARFAVEGGAGGKAQREHEKPAFLAGLSDAQIARVIPTDGIDAVLQAGTRKAREAVFERWGAALTWDAPDGLDSDQKAAWEAALKEFRKDQQIGKVPTPEDYSKLPGLFRSKSLRDSKALTANKAALAMRKKELKTAGLVTGAILQQLRQELAAAEAWGRSAALRARLAELDAELDAVREDAGKLPKVPEEEAPDTSMRATFQKKIDAAKAALEPVEARQAKLATIVTTIEASLAAAGAHEAVCGTCGTSTRREALEKRLAAVRQKRVTIADEAKAATKSKLEAEAALADLDRLERHRAVVREKTLRDLEERKVALRKRRDRARAQQDEVKAAIATLGGETTEPPKRSAADVEADLRAKEAVAATREAVAKEADEVKRATRALEDVKVLERESGRVLQDFLTAVKTKAEAAVNRCMPEGVRAELVLEDVRGNDACEWSVIGRDGKPHNRHTVSGSEYAALLIAYSVALAGDVPYRILFIDDDVLGRFSPARLQAFLTAVAAAVKDGVVSQAIACWTRPSEAQVDGWTVVEV